MEIKIGMVFIWAQWMCTIIVTMIILFNFLIAEVSNTYQKVLTSGIKKHYSEMSRMNFLYQKYAVWLRIFETKKNFNLMVFTNNRDTIFANQEGEDSSFSAMLIEAIVKQNKNVKESIQESIYNAKKQAKEEFNNRIVDM